MDEDMKRKAPEAETLGTNGRANKRQRLSDYDKPPSEEAGYIKDIGLKFVECLRQARDKSGRLVADAFLTLPNKEDVPEYYDRIALPIAIDTIEDKLLHGKYANLSAVESDAKRMVNNAKHFNDRKSQIYEDAERVRKTTFNYMVKHNPAYRDKQYVAIATPLPEESQGLSGDTMEGSETTRRQSEEAAQENSNDEELPAQSSSQDHVPGEDQSSKVEESRSLDFAGKDLQEAQEMIISELIKYEESGLVIYTPFINLPARSLTDYYSVIKRPLSLKGAQKRVRGIHGRAAPTGISDYKSWEAFEQAVNLIWRNAQEYNEDGSEMYMLANDFEKHFKDLVARAKEKVSNPSQPTLKLKMSSAPKASIKLKIGGQRESPSTVEAASTVNPATSGILIDNKALERQQQHVKASINGHAPLNNAQSRRSGSPKLKDDLDGRATPSSSAALPPAVNGIKAEAAVADLANAETRPPSARPTSAPRQLRSPAPPVMPPPSRPGYRNTSGSPRPHQPLQSLPNGANMSHAATHTYPTLLDDKRRTTGKTAADSILPLLTVSTHPTLKVDNQFCFHFPASDTQTQISKIVTFPAQNNIIQIEPSLASSLHLRPYRLFVTVNGQRMAQKKRPTVNMQEQSRPLFEAKLNYGVNPIEVEVVAAAAAKVGARNVTEHLEVEKMTIFAYVLRDSKFLGNT